MQIDAGTSDSEGSKEKSKKDRGRNLEKSNSKDWVGKDRYAGGNNSGGTVR